MFFGSDGRVEKEQAYHGIKIIASAWRCAKFQWAPREACAVRVARNDVQGGAV